MALFPDIVSPGLRPEVSFLWKLGYPQGIFLHGFSSRKNNGKFQTKVYAVVTEKHNRASRETQAGAGEKKTFRYDRSDPDVRWSRDWDSLAAVSDEGSKTLPDSTENYLDIDGDSREASGLWASEGQKELLKVEESAPFPARTEMMQDEDEIRVGVTEFLNDPFPEPSRILSSNVVAHSDTYGMTIDVSPQTKDLLHKVSRAFSRDENLFDGNSEQVPDGFNVSEEIQDLSFELRDSSVGAGSGISLHASSNRVSGEVSSDNGAGSPTGLDSGPVKARVKKRSKVQMSRAKDWKQRVDLLAGRIVELPPTAPVADVLERFEEQMTPGDYCMTVKSLGDSGHWLRALELFEWFQLQKNFGRSWRMLVAIISILGRAHQVQLAEEIFFLHVAPPGWLQKDGSHLQSGQHQKYTKLMQTIQQQEKAQDERGLIHVYNAMMGMYAARGAVPRVKQLFSLMKDAGCQPDLVTYNTILNALCKSGDELPFYLLGKMRAANIRPDIITYNTLIAACGRRGRYQEAEELFRGMFNGRCKPDVWTCNAMIAAYVSAGLVENATHVLHKMQTRNIKPDAISYNSLLNAYAKRGMMVECHALLASMKSRRHGVDEVTYNTLIAMYCKLGKIDEALKTLKRMGLGSSKPDTATYNIIINALCKSGELQEAEKLLEEMKSNNVKPSMIVFVSLIIAYGRAKLPQEAERMFVEMQYQGAKPQVQAYKAMAEMYQRCGLLAKSRRVSEQMRTMSPLASSPAVGSGHAPAAPNRIWRNPLLAVNAPLPKSPNFPENSKQTAKAAEMRGWPEHSNGAVPGLEVGSGAQEAVFAERPQRASMEAKAYGEQSEGAGTCDRSEGEEEEELDSRAWSPGMETNIVQPASEPSDSAHSRLLGNLMMMKGDVEEAENAMREYQEAGHALDVKLLNAMMGMYSQNGELAKAADVFRSMPAAQCAPTVGTYHILIKMYCKKGMLEPAIWLLHHMTDQGYSPDCDIYSVLIASHARACKWEAATDLFERMQKVGVAPTVDIYEALLDTYKRAGKSDGVERVGVSMQSAGFASSPDLLLAKLEALAREGNASAAQLVFEAMEAVGSGLDCTAYTSLVEAYLRGREHAMALKTLSEMKGRGFLLPQKLLAAVVCSASECLWQKDALVLLEGLEKLGFELPLRTLTASSNVAWAEGDYAPDGLAENDEPAGRLALANSMLDLLWRFGLQRRAAAFFSRALLQGVFRSTLAMVEEGNWRADFRGLSCGAALVALHLWMQRMQEAALEGSPRPASSVAITAGISDPEEAVTLKRTVQAYLWNMGAPFRSLPKAGVLLAKSHSLVLWIKDAPRAEDLYLRDARQATAKNTVAAFKGALVETSLLPALQELDASGMTDGVKAKVFSRLLRLEPSKRAEWIEAERRTRGGRPQRELKRKLRKVVIAELGTKYLPRSKVQSKK